MKLICFDCDSTLSSIEGIDELGRLVGEDVFAQVEELTNQAMNGEVPVEEVFGRRLDLIQPSLQHCEEVGQLYLDTILPGVEETISALYNNGWHCVIISGGFTEAIRPLGSRLGINEIHAVGLSFDEKGAYAGFDENSFTSRSGGKPDCILHLKEKYKPEKIVMVGDGASDLETQELVDLFIGFGAVVAREKVKAGAQAFVTDFKKIKTLCEEV